MNRKDTSKESGNKELMKLLDASLDVQLFLEMMLVI